MSKGKLVKFAEMASFPNVVQVPVSKIINNEFFLKGKWNHEFFSCTKPITLELGCGKGEYTIGLAEIYPERNFIGVDIKGARIWKGAKKAWMNKIENVGFLRTRIDFIGSFFAAGEVEEIWITFPDPQLKKAKKRLTSSGFLSNYRKFLTQGGFINLKTDSKELYTYTKALAVYNNFEIDICTNNLYSSGYDDKILSIKTFYEQMWLNKGLEIHYIRFRISSERKIEEPPGAW